MHYTIVFLALPKALRYVWERSGLLELSAATAKKKAGDNDTAAADEAAGDDDDAQAADEAEAAQGGGGDARMADAAAPGTPSAAGEAAARSAFQTPSRMPQSPNDATPGRSAAGQVAEPDEEKAFPSEALQTLHKLATSFYEQWNAVEFVGGLYSDFQLEHRPVVSDGQETTEFVFAPPVQDAVEAGGGDEAPSQVRCIAGGALVPCHYRTRQQASVRALEQAPVHRHHHASPSSWCLWRTEVSPPCRCRS
jgi:hypothetical protein